MTEFPADKFMAGLARIPVFGRNRIGFTLCEPRPQRNGLCNSFHGVCLGVALRNQTHSVVAGGGTGEADTVSTEHDTGKPGSEPIAGKPVIRLGNVSQPSITIYRPPADKDTGAAVIDLCPAAAITSSPGAGRH